MLNLKREEIKTMDRDIVSLQGGGKDSKGNNAGGTLFEKTFIEGDLEQRLTEAFLTFERNKTLIAEPAIESAPKAAPPPRPEFAIPEPEPQKITPTASITAAKPAVPPAPLAQEINREIKMEEKPGIEAPAGASLAEKKPETETERIGLQEEEKKEQDDSTGPVGKEEQSIEEKIKEELRNRREEEERTKEEEETKTEEEERRKAMDKRREEEIKRKEEEKEERERLERKRSLVLPVLLKEAKEKIEIDIAELNKQLQKLAEKDQPLEDKKMELMARTEQIKTSELGMIIEKEKEIEARKDELEKAGKRNLTLAQEKLVSEKLWEIEDRRKQIERRRWEVEDQITRAEVDAKKIELELKEKTKEKEEIKTLIKKLETKIKLLDFADAKKSLMGKIDRIKEEWDKIMPEIDAIKEQKNRVEETLKELTESEQAIGEELKMVEEKEKQAITPDEKREIEKMRWKVGGELRKTTKDKWEYEQKKEKILAKELETNSKLEEVEKKLKDVQDKISADEIVLEKEGIDAGNLRDEVGTILRENEFDFDPEILEEIPESEAIEEAAIWKPKVKKEIESEEKEETKTEESATPAREGTEKKEEPLGGAGVEEIGQEPRLGREVPETNLPPAASGGEAFREPIEERPMGNLVPQGGKNLGPSGPAGGNVSGGSEMDNRWQQGWVGGVLPKDTDRNLGMPSGSENGQPSNPLENRWNQNQPENAAAGGPAALPQKAPGQKNAPQTMAEDYPLAEDVPQKPGKGKKILVRFLILLACLGIFAVAFKFIFTKKEPENKNQQNEEEQKKDTDEESGGKENGDDSGDNGEDENGDGNNKEDENGNENNGDNDAAKKSDEPVSLIAVISTIPIPTDNLDNARALISPYLQNKFKGEGYYRLLIENKKENNYAGLKEFINIFNIKTPEGFTDHLDNNFTLFVYSSNDENRLGFVAKITDSQGFEDLMKNWEPTMEKDTETLFKFLGKTSAAKPSYFKTGNVPNSKLTFRYLSFPLRSQQNAGLCYAMTEKYFVLTSSGISLQKAFNQLQ